MTYENFNVDFIEACGFDFQLGTAALHICCTAGESAYEQRELLETATWFIDRLIASAREGRHRHHGLYIKTPKEKVKQFSDELGLSFELQEALYGFCLWQETVEKDMAHCIHLLETAKGNIKLHLDNLS